MQKWVIGAGDDEAIFARLVSQHRKKELRYICFDYFDTLVTRTVYPEYTKEIASRLLSMYCGGKVAGQELYSLRQELELRSCEENEASGGELECYLQELAGPYLELIRKGRPELFPNLDKELFTNLLLDLELQVEKKVQRPVAEVVSLVKRLREAGVKTVLISDFYLPSSHFNQMLLHHGLQGLFDLCYISADHRLAKGSGRLYQKICKDLDCDGKDLVMIGDNVHSDVAKAAENGLAAILLENQGSQDGNWPADLEDPAVFFEKELQESHSRSSYFFEMSCSLWLFIYKLLQRLLAEGAHEVFFFSKEGEFLKKLFDSYQERVYGRSLVKSHYLLVSRKASFIASLKTLEKEDFSRLFSYYRDISCRDFLLSLNLDDSLAKEICKKEGLDFLRRYQDFPESSSYQILRNSKLLKELYERQREQQKNNFIRYLNSFNGDKSRKSLHIVDVGWKGSIQDNIYHILGGEVALTGYYLGSLFASSKKEDNQKYGLLFDDKPRLSDFFHVYNNNRSLFEMLLGASHGSADGYYNKSQFEALDTALKKRVAQKIGGEVEEADTLYVATLDLPKERQLFVDVIAPIQTSLYQGFLAMTDAFCKHHYRAPTRLWFARQHARMVFTPREEEVELFEKLYHLENFGVFEYTSFGADAGFSILTRLKNLQAVIKSKTMLETGVWPPIILRRLGIGFYRHVDGFRRMRRVFKGF